MAAHRFLAFRSIACLLTCVGALVFAAPASANCLSLGGGDPPMVGVAALSTPDDQIVSVEVTVQSPGQSSPSTISVPVSVNGEFVTGTSPFGSEGDAKGTELQIASATHESGTSTLATTNPVIVWNGSEVTCDAAGRIPLDNAQPVAEDPPPAEQSTAKTPDEEKDEGAWLNWRRTLAAALAMCAVLGGGVVIARRRHKRNDDGSTEVWHEEVQPGEEKDGTERLIPAERFIDRDKPDVYGGFKPATSAASDTPAPASEDAPTPPADEPSILDEIDESEAPPAGEPSILDEIDEGVGPPGLA